MADIDRLIDKGLNLYGVGDLDGALEAWEQALAIDADNAQANSYVDYVRQNYDILATDAGVAVTDSAVPFGIVDEPEYIIEITAGVEVGEAAEEPAHRDSVEEGWFIDDEDPMTVRVGRSPSRDLAEPLTLELEADEPPLSEGIGFDDATREYIGRRPPTDEFADEPSSFRAESTPLGFGMQETEVKKRSTGFVQPVPRQKPPTPASPPIPSPGDAPLTTTAELRVRVRTPSGSPPLTKPSKPVEPVELVELVELVEPPPAASAAPELELGGAGRDVTARIDVSSEDLLASLPVPRRITPIRGSKAITDSSPRITTRDLPANPRPPATTPPPPPDGHDSLELREPSSEIALANAKTRDLTRGDENEEVPARMRAPIGGDDPVIGVPTRELGLRPAGSKRPPSVFPDEDATTTQTDARQIRQEAAQRVPVAKDGTRKDIVLAFDPIDARTELILAEVDADAPADETKDDHVRRRISTLLMRAAEWNARGELDRAVTAVDLALSEEPTSALAQKLVHRNRDAIMTVFQSYLGDLERQPQLAKPLHELAAAPISPRAAFLLSRIDGMLSIDEILDVSGMPRLEAYRHLCQLFLRGILR